MPEPCCPQIFILLISNGEKILSNVNVVVRGQVRSENSSLPVAVCVHKWPPTWDERATKHGIEAFWIKIYFRANFDQVTV